MAGKGKKTNQPTNQTTNQTNKMTGKSKGQRQMPIEVVLLKSTFPEALFGDFHIYLIGQKWVTCPPLAANDTKKYIKKEKKRKAGHTTTLKESGVLS